jgi:hypothetical protein
VPTHRSRSSRIDRSVAGYEGVIAEFGEGPDCNRPVCVIGSREPDEEAGCEGVNVGLEGRGNKLDSRQSIRDRFSGESYGFGLVELRLENQGDAANRELRTIAQEVIPIAINLIAGLCTSLRTVSFKIQ